MTAQNDQPATPPTKVVQITNIAPQATKDQMQTLFGFLGKIEDIRLYPTIRDVSVPVQSRICYVKFFDAICVGVAQHMTNTVFIDRALIVTPFHSSTNEIPDEYRALEIAAQANIVPGLIGNNSKLPPHVTNQIEGVQPNQVITTHDPVLISSGLPPYPPLPINYDSVRIEEIRRTLLASNIDSSITAQQLIDFFGTAGDVKYVRFCVRETDPNRYALVEFSEQSSIISALRMSGTELAGKPVQICHSTMSIEKPQAKSNEAAQREIEEAMTRVKEAQNLISAAIDPVIGILSKDKKRGRSRSKSRRSRSRSRERRRRRRSRSRSRSRRRRSRSKKRSRSRSRRRSRSRERRRRSRDKRRTRSRSRSRSKGRSRTSRSRSKRREKSKREGHKEDKESSSKRDKKEDKNDEVSKSDNCKEKTDLMLGDKDIEKEGSGKKSLSKSPEKRRSPSVRKSRSPSRRDSRSASRRRTPSRKKSRSPRRRGTRSPSRRTRSRSRRKSRTPARRRSRTPRKSRSPRKKRSSRSPRRKRSRTPPAKWRGSRSPSSPPRRRSKSNTP